MKIFATCDSRQIWVDQMERPFDSKLALLGHRYVAMVFSNDATVTAAEQRAVASALFSSGCRYGVFAGHDCAAWEFALDAVCIESTPDFRPPDEDFTMTTSHVGATVEEVIFFGLLNTSFDAHDFDHFLVLFIGPSSGLHKEVAAAVRAVWPDAEISGS